MMLGTLMKLDTLQSEEEDGIVRPRVIDFINAALPPVDVVPKEPEVYNSSVG